MESAWRAVCLLMSNRLQRGGRREGSSRAPASVQGALRGFGAVPFWGRGTG